MKSFKLIIIAAVTAVVHLSATALADQDIENDPLLALHGAGEYIETIHGKLYYETEGSGPVVMLVAGGPGSGHASFHPWFSRLADDHTVIYFDNIGRGRSDRLVDNSMYTVERDAEDIEALRKALGIEQFALIGHSYGGMPALAYAAKYSNRLTRLVLSDTIHSGEGWQQNIDSANNIARNQFPEVWRSLMEMREQGVLSSADAYANPYGGALGDLYWHDFGKRKLLFRSGQPEDAFNGDVYFAILGDDPEWKVGGPMATFDPRQKLAEIDTKVLIAVGRYDRVATPKIAFELFDVFDADNAEIVVFENSAHRPWIEESDVYFERIGEFLAE
ncbi:MAG: alpha/beta fold hydrolase [Marinicaulis sp.]|nr:alpha/beta fold hydrolase [Marinicaulis sp.]